jgi:WD40 repeat protein
MTVKLKLAGLVLLGVTLLGSGTGPYAHYPFAPPVAHGADPAPSDQVEPPRDLYGDALPAGAVARLGSVRFRHQCCAVTYSADGKLLVSVDHGGGLRIWDADTGMELGRYVPKLNKLKRQGNDYIIGSDHAEFTSASISPDDKTVAVGCADHTVRLIDVESQKELRVLGSHYVEDSKARHRTAVCYSPDGKFVVSGDAADGTVRVWNPASGEELHRWFGLDDLWTVAVAADNNTVAVAAGRAGVHLYDFKNKKLVQARKDGASSVRGVAFSKDGKQLVYGDTKGNLRVWDMQKDSEPRDMATPWSEPGEKEPILKVAFSPDGKSVAAVSKEEYCRTYDIATGEAVLELAPWWGEDLAYAPNGKTIATSAYYCIRLWDATTGKEDARFAGHWAGVSMLGFFPNGKSLITASQDKTVRRWDLTTSKQLQCYGSNKNGLARHDRWGIAAWAASPDGKTVSWAEVGPSGIHKLDLATGEVTKRFYQGDTGTEILAHSPDNTLLAQYTQGSTMQMGGGIFLWDVKTGSGPRKLEGTWQQSLTTLVAPAFSADGKLLACGMCGFDGDVCLWDTATGKLQKRIEGFEERVCCVALSPNGKMVAAGSEDHSIRIWDVETGKEIAHCKGHTGDVTCISFTPDSKTLVSGSAGPDRSVRRWDVVTGKELARFVGHDYVVKTIAVSPDGRYVASGSNDTTVLIWDLEKAPKVEANK